MLRPRVHLQSQPLPPWAEKDGRETWQCRRLEGLGLFSKLPEENTTLSITTVQMYIMERPRPLLGQQHAGDYTTESKPQVRNFCGIYQSPEELNGIQTENNLLSNWNSTYFWKTIQKNRMSHEVLELPVNHWSQSTRFSLTEMIANLKQPSCFPENKTLHTPTSSTVVFIFDKELCNVKYFKNTDDLRCLMPK